ncbi:MAG: hypothetical protein ABIJ10_07010 [Candidatus Micrarchaeota archaeon]
MVSFELMNEESRETIIGTWKTMNEDDKGHFINQVALALSIWGSDKKGRNIIVEILDIMAKDKIQTLADFGLYVSRALELDDAKDIEDKIKRASLIIEGYRIKNALSSEPHMQLF